MRWPGIESLYGPTLRQSTVFASAPQGEKGEDAGKKRWEALHKRVIEHVSTRRRGSADSGLRLIVSTLFNRTSESSPRTTPLSLFLV